MTGAARDRRRARAAAPAPRAPEHSAGVDELRFDRRGLLPAVVQDADDGTVLMLGWMDREALAATLASGQVHFHSRSRDALWRKGETSGHTLALVGLRADCDADALLVVARPAGPTCHTGERSCFHGDLAGAFPPEGLTLAPLFGVLHRRAAERPAGSYSVRLMDDRDLALKKLLEEALEVALAVKNRDRANLVWELADLLYHAAVVMVAEGVAPSEVNAELVRRAGRGAP
jgi:phosphoribosyl-AMP cyclohydrolase / phosphoribosyl-ATP pyrophosphohydrolase